MNVSKWAYGPDKCDGDYCPGDCDECGKAEDDDETERPDWPHRKAKARRRPGSAPVHKAAYSGLVLYRPCTEGLGKKRLTQYANDLQEIFAEYADIWNGDDPDTEFARAKLDEKLRQIFGEDFHPWEVRYSR